VEEFGYAGEEKEEKNVSSWDEERKDIERDDERNRTTKG
jgi:hypothetical protein